MKNLIGITGGIGCGKSKLVQMICESYHCLPIDTDTIAKEIMKPGHLAYKMIVEQFGNKILNKDKEIDSKKLAAIVMSDSKQLEILNRLTHPLVIKEVKRIVEENKDNYDAVILESALLLDTPLKDLCNEIWNVSADEKIRLKRLCDYRGYTEERAKSIMENQQPPLWYMEHSTKTFINNRDGGADMEEMLKISMIPYTKY